MAFNPKYSSIPMVSDNIGMPDLPITFPSGGKFTQSGQGSTFTNMKVVMKGGAKTPYLLSPSPSYGMLFIDDYIQLDIEVDNVWMKTLPFVVEPFVFGKKDWCIIAAYDTTRYNYPTAPLVVFFKAFQRKIEQQNVVVKYDDEVGTIIPLSQKQFDVLTFTTQPMNSDYARLLFDIAEWDNVTFQYWDTKNNGWSTALNVAKKAEAWNKTTYPKTLGTTIQGSFVIKQ